MGLSVWFDSSILKASKNDKIRFEFENDDQTIEEVNVSEMQEAFKEYNFLFSFIESIHDKITYQDYLTMPIKLIKTIELYKQTKLQKEIENMKKKN